MERTNERYSAYIQILKEGLIPVMGCTEPIALTYAAAEAREILGGMPGRVLVEASGSIIKNAKSVIISNTNRLKRIPVAATAGIIAGKTERKLEVIAEATPEEINQMKEFLETVPIDVRHIDQGITFDIVVALYESDSYAKVRIANCRTNIVLVEKNHRTLSQKPVEGRGEEGPADRSLLDMKHIWDFINTMDVTDVKEVLDCQVVYNTAISEGGLRGNYGANIGQVLLDTYGDNIRTRAEVKAAAGSDARMNECELPVVINLGGGDQGITTSVPVIEYTKRLSAGEEKLYRALALSNLTTIRQKALIEKLSAYCGAVSAGAGAGAEIAYLCGGNYKDVVYTVVNTLTIMSGIVCDRAKASYAAKIVSAVDAGILGYNMYKRGQQLYGGDGIVTKGMEATIKNVGRLGKESMKETNEGIIEVMIGE